MKKRFPITDYLEVVLTDDDKTAIYIKGEHFIQCSHVLTTVHTEEIENILLLESVDDIKEAPGTIVIEPETRFFVHCSNLQAWVENNFNSRMLHSNLSFPLLKKLVEEGCVSSIILKEEIAKRFERISSKIIHFLFEYGYLDFLSKDELSAIITPNFKILLKELLTGRKSDNQLLNYLLERSLNEDLKKIIKIELAKCLKLEDLHMIRFLVEYGHLDSLSLSKEDLAEIIPPNFYLILVDLLRGRKHDLPLLDHFLERSLNEDLKRIVKDDLSKILEKGSLDMLCFFYRRGYLEYFSTEKLSAIITPKFKRLLKYVFRDRVRISGDRAILGYLLKRSLNEELKMMFNKEIAEIFERGVSKDIEILIKHRFLNYLSKEELSAIIKLNLPKIVTMDIDFKKYLFLLSKEDLSTALTQDVLHNASKSILKSLPFEFKTIMKELIRRKFRDFYDFDSLLEYLMEMKTAPNREDLLIVIKDEISKMLKKDSSTKFLDFLYARSGGYFNLLDKDEFDDILTQDILHNVSIKHINYFPFEFNAGIKELLRRFDMGDETIKREIKTFFKELEYHREFIIYDLLVILFKRYEVVDDTTKNEIKKYFDVILGINRQWIDKDEFKNILGSNILKGMLTTLSIQDIIHLRQDHDIIDLQMYEEEVTRRDLNQDPKKFQK